MGVTKDDKGPKDGKDNSEKAPKENKEIADRPRPPKISGSSDLTASGTDQHFIRAEDRPVVVTPWKP